MSGAAASSCRTGSIVAIAKLTISTRNYDAQFDSLAYPHPKITLGHQLSYLAVSIKDPSVRPAGTIPGLFRVRNSREFPGIVYAKGHTAINPDYFRLGVIRSELVNVGRPGRRNRRRRSFSGSYQTEWTISI